MKHESLKELVLQALEHERSSVSVYRTALHCAVAPELTEEWSRYLQESEVHLAALASLCAALELDPEERTPGREVVQGLGAALVEAMTKALLRVSKEAAQLVACECVVLVETKGHLGWEMLGKAAKELPGPAGSALREAHAQIAEQEDEHLHRTRGRCRELWIAALDLAAVVPPPEQHRHAPSAPPAAHAAQQQRGSASA